MSILIRNMEMPKNCAECKIVCSVEKAEKNPYKGRQPSCPLIEVPPHGRLIDADEIIEHKYTTIPSNRKKYADGKPKSDEEVIAFKFGWNNAIDAIVENAPTIIEAEGKDG